MERDMWQLRRCSAVVAMVVAIPAAAQSTIDFNDGTNGGVVGGFYSGRGVTFTSARWDSFVSPNEGLVGAGGLKFIHTTTGTQPKASNPIIASFIGAVSLVSVRALNVGFNGARIEALDIGGNLLGASEVIGPDELGISNHPLLNVNAVGIRSVRFFQPRSVASEGMLWDNLSFSALPSTVVPEPSSYVLMATGLVVMGFTARRRRSA
jgi:hypothetical protein